MKMTIKLSIFFLFLSLFIIRPTASYAYWHGHGHDYVSVNLGVWPGAYYYGSPYYYPYYADPYYYPRYPAYAVVSSPDYQPVVVNGTTYYVNNGAYYTYTQYGYQAVAAPVGATVPAVQAAAVTEVPVSAASDDSITVNIPNGQGGYSAVVIKRSGKGFVGPQGEFYPEFPKVTQLQVMYGK